MIDDALGNVEIVLPECTWRVMYGRTAEIFDDTRRSMPGLEFRTDDGVGALAMRVEPQAVQIVAEALANQVQAPREWLDGWAIGDQHHLSLL